MSGRKLVVAVVACTIALVAVGIAGAAGISDGDLAAADGSYGFSGTAAGSFFVVDPFDWNVRLRTDGTVDGSYEYRQVRDGVELTVSGSLDCAYFSGNRVWVGGTIEQSSRASLVGLDMWFQAQDNAEGEGEHPDMSSTVGAGNPGTALQYCTDHPEVRFPFYVEQGDLQVQSSDN